MNKKYIGYLTFFFPLFLIINSIFIVDTVLADDDQRDDFVIWEAQINFDGGNFKTSDFVIMGEATNANDGPPADIYDTPKSPLPPSPYVYAYFDDNLGAAPYNSLTGDFRHYCDGIEKNWDLSIRWDMVSYPTSINISWEKTSYNPSPYNSIFLRDSSGVILADMLSVEFYTFTVNSFGSANFLISCENVSCAIEGENCYNPYNVTIDQDETYEVDHSTIGFNNDYDDTLLGSYDDGEDTIYHLDVVTNVKVDIILDSITSGIAFAIFDDCPRIGTLIDQAIDNGSGYASLLDYNLSGGEYYLMVDGNDVSFDYHLVITSIQNNPPIAVNDTVSVFEDSIVFQNISSNDVDLDGSLNLSSISILDQPNHGSIIVFNNGTIQYIPNKNYYGPDLLTYTIKDNLGADSNIATVEISIIDVNDEPVADYTFQPDDPLTMDTIYLNSTSTDVDGTIVNWTWDMADGSLRFGEKISYSYADNGNYEVELTVQDDDGGIDQIVKTVSVSNVPPSAQDDFESCDEDGFVWIDVISNDSDIDGSIDLTSLMVVDNPDHGSVSVNLTTGEILYIPISNWFGTDSFIYQISDDDGATDNAIVTITVFDINDPPVAVDDSSSVLEDNDVWITVLGNDYDIDGSIVLSSVTIVNPPDFGTFSVNTTTGEIHYTPNSDYFGNDSFTYTFTDDDGTVSNEAIVNITILKEDDYPVAGFTIEPSDIVTYQTVYFNSTSYDPDGTIVNWTWDMDDGTLLYGEQIIHFYENNGDYEVELTVHDNEGLIGSNIKTVEVNNQPPVAVDDVDDCDEDAITWTDVLSNDNDVDGSVISSSLTVISGPSYGSTMLNTTTAEIGYMPNHDFYGSDSYVYQIADDDGDTDTATVLLTVNDVNDDPVADFTIEPLNPSTSELVYFNSTSTDVDGTIMNWIWDMDDGTLLYGEEITYFYLINGEYTIELKVIDDDGSIGLKNRSITIGNRPPVAVDDMDDCDEDTVTWTDVLSNDNDVDGILDLTSLIVINGPSHGSTLINTTTGLIKYQPFHDYYGSDSYVYQVADDDGDTDTATVLLTVNDVNDDPVADFTVEPLNPSTADLIFFNSTSTDVDGSIVDWSWDFGDGNSSTGEQVTHSYQEIGSYDVILLIEDDDGATDQISKTLTITVTNHPPRVTIVQPKEDDTIDDVVVISGTSSDEDDNSDIEYVQIRINQHSWIKAIGTIDWLFYWDTSYYPEGAYRISARSYDGMSYSPIDMINVTVLRNDPPYKPKNPNPTNGSTGIDINITLQWTGGDPDGDLVTYTVYFGETTNPPMVKNNLKKTQISLVNLSEMTTYYWKIKAKDGSGYTNTSSLWSFTTLDVNYEPYKPSNVFPDDDQTEVDIPVVLQVRISDPDGDSLSVEFYNAVDHSLIGVDYGVLNNTIAQITWLDCDYQEVYHWYTIVSDGEYETSSDTWTFTTREQDISLEVHASGGWGCSATIENNGDDDVEQVEWTLSIENTGLFRRPNITTTETIDIIPAGYHSSIYSSCFGFGRVRILIIIDVDEELIIDEEYEGFVFGPLLRIRS